MHVLHVIGTLNVGGIERLITDLALAQKSLGHEVAVCCLLRREGKLLEVLETEGIPVLEASYGRSPLRLIRRLSSVLREWKPQIIHSHVNFSLPWQTAANLLGSRSAFVVTQHTLLSVSPSVKIRSFILYRLASPFIDRHTAVSEYASRYAGSLYRLPNRKLPIVIPNGIKVAQYAFDAGARSRLRCEWGIADDEVLWGSVGRLDRVKGFDWLVEAFCEARKSLPNIRLAVAGQGPEREQLERTCADLGCAQAVTWLGLRADVPQVLSAFDFYVQPSRNEAAPLSVLEALASGLHVVASDVGGMREIARRSAHVTQVPPEDSKALRDAMIAVTLNYNGERSASCPPEYTFDAMLKSYERLYAQVVAHPRLHKTSKMSH